MVTKCPPLRCSCVKVWLSIWVMTLLLRITPSPKKGLSPCLNLLLHTTWCHWREWLVTATHGWKIKWRQYSLCKIVFMAERWKCLKWWNESALIKLNRLYCRAPVWVCLTTPNHSIFLSLRIMGLCLLCWHSTTELAICMWDTTLSMKICTVLNPLTIEMDCSHRLDLKKTFLFWIQERQGWTFSRLCGCHRCSNCGKCQTFPSLVCSGSRVIWFDQGMYFGWGLLC